MLPVMSANVAFGRSAFILLVPPPASDITTASARGWSASPVRVQPTTFASSK
jgi:hypothetical protein